MNSVTIKLISLILLIGMLITGCTNADGQVDAEAFNVHITQGGVELIDEDGEIYGVEREGNRPYVTAPSFDLLIPQGRISNHTSINKYGRNTEIDSGVTADIWDGGATGAVSLIWVAPTEARVHDITSTSTADNATGGGARTVMISGLPNWDTAEVSEGLTMNGTADVATSSYVIIYRIEVITKGSTSANVGTITATARTDNTITAQISPGAGQTQMAILGVPSTQTAYMTNFYISLLRKNATGGLDMSLEVNQEPDVVLTTFVIKHTIGLFGSGTSDAQHFYNPYKGFTGPAIIKIQATSSANDNDVSAGFDVILVDN